MPIQREGCELHIVPEAEQSRVSDGNTRNFGKYQVFINGVSQKRTLTRGIAAETRGPGGNRPAEKNRRVEAQRYPLFTQGGTRYITVGYRESTAMNATPRPGLELKEADQRIEILIHPGQRFLSSLG